MAKTTERLIVRKYVGPQLDLDIPKTSWDIVIDDQGRGHILISHTDWCIVMGRLRGQSYQHIGEFLNMPPSTVQYKAKQIGITKSQLHPKVSA